MHKFSCRESGCRKIDRVSCGSLPKLAQQRCCGGSDLRGPCETTFVNHLKIGIRPHLRPHYTAFKPLSRLSSRRDLDILDTYTRYERAT